MPDLELYNYIQYLKKILCIAKIEFNLIQTILVPEKYSVESPIETQ